MFLPCAIQPALNVRTVFQDSSHVLWVGTSHGLASRRRHPHARRALASRDFRRLFAIRLVSQSADGLFQAALVASVAFSPEDQKTAAGFAVAVAASLKSAATGDAPDSV